MQSRPTPAIRIVTLPTFDMSTLIFAAVAIFFVWKLRSVLGQKTGEEGRGLDPAARDSRRADAGPPGDPGNVIHLPGAAAGAAAANDPALEKWAGLAERGSKVWTGLDEIAARDAGFSAKGFVEGARKAYEMIILAFAAGDRKTLKSLLAADVYDSFAQAIAHRETRGQTMNTTFVSIDKATLADAQVRGGSAQLAMRFRSKLVNMTTGKDGQPIDEMQGKVTDSIDVWTFARELASRDPNWKLIATESDPAVTRGSA